MQCYTPMFRVYKPSNPKEGKIVPRSEVMEEVEHNNNAIRYKLQTMNNYYAKHLIDKRYQMIPCGYCYACKLNKSAEWATRSVLESFYHSHNWFITLTYDEMNLPLYENFNVEDGEGNILRSYENDGTWTGTLEPEHVTKFIKRLRKHFKIEGIKYIYCGEYGENTKRPHYHMLLFGAPFKLNQFYDCHVDKEFFKEHWKSKELDKLWPYGMHDIACLEWSNAAYVCRYTMKKICGTGTINPDLYASEGKIPEVFRMSRNPGIGKKYYDDHVMEIYENDEMIMKTIRGNTGAFKPPKAFDRMLEKDYPELYQTVKYRRKKCAERGYKTELLLTNYSDYEKLKMKAEKTLTKAKMLPRVGEYD